MGDKIHPTHFTVPELPWKVNDDASKLRLKLEAYQKQIDSMFSTLEFYGLTFQCPKCKTYHSVDHRCFNCRFDHTAQD